MPVAGMLSVSALSAMGAWPPAPRASPASPAPPYTWHGYTPAPPAGGGGPAADGDVTQRLRCELRQFATNYLKLNDTKNYYQQNIPGKPVAISISWKDAQREFTVAAGARERSNGMVTAATPDDTFMFGSGSKPFAAAAVMRLVEMGIIAAHDPVSKHVDPWLAKYANTTIAQLWGRTAAKLTVEQVIRMNSGVKDYDVGANGEFPSPVDRANLKRAAAGEVVPPQDFFGPVGNASLYPGGAWDGEPGVTLAYSSTNFVFAGIVLAQHAPAAYGGTDRWQDMDTLGFYPKAVRDALSSTRPVTAGRLADVGLTGAGVSGGGQLGYGPWDILHQDASGVTGYTCANIVAPTRDVARFWWALLKEGSLVNRTTLRRMTEFRTFNRGWNAGKLRYGSGIMKDGPDGCPGLGGCTGPDGWGSNVGHGGNVLGFTSTQALYWGVDAVISAAVNHDFDANGSSGAIACEVMRVGARVLLGVEVDPRLCWGDRAESFTATMAQMPSLGCGQPSQ